MSVRSECATVMGVKSECATVMSVRSECATVMGVSIAYTVCFVPRSPATSNMVIHVFDEQRKCEPLDMYLTRVACVSVH